MLQIVLRLRLRVVALLMLRSLVLSIFASLLIKFRFTGCPSHFCPASPAFLFHTSPSASTVSPPFSLYVRLSLHRCLHISVSGAVCEDIFSLSKLAIGLVICDFCRRTPPRRNHRIFAAPHSPAFASANPFKSVSLQHHHHHRHHHH